MNASWGNASTGRTLELEDVDGDRLELAELPLGAGPYERGSVHVRTVASHGEVVLAPGQAAELRAWLRLGRGASPFEVSFPGADAAQTRACRLAMFVLAEPPGEADPLRANPEGRLMRDLPIARAGARRVLELLRRGGWVDADGRLAGTVRT